MISKGVKLKSKVDWEPWIELIKISVNEYDVRRFVNPMFKKEKLPILKESNQTAFSDVKVSEIPNTPVAYWFLSLDEKEELCQLKDE